MQDCGSYICVTLTLPFLWEQVDKPCKKKTSDVVDDSNAKVRREASMNG